MGKQPSQPWTFRTTTSLDCFQLILSDRLSKLQVLNLARNQFGGALPDLAPFKLPPFYNLVNLRNLDISYNNFQGVFNLSFFSSTQNLTSVDVTGNYFTGPAPNFTVEGSPVHTSTNCFDAPAKHQRPASVCAALPAPPCFVDIYGVSCSNWQPGLLGQYDFQDPCAFAYCNGDGHCVYDYAATANTSCDYIPGNDFCSFQKCRNGTCAQISPTPEGGDCGLALNVIDFVPGPFAENKGCATASCMNGTCTLSLLFPDGTPCNITGLNTELISPECVTGKCSEGMCQTDSYKSDDTPCVAKRVAASSVMDKDSALLTNLPLAITTKVATLANVMMPITAFPTTPMKDDII
eukprot:SM000099S25190  [mRNA]  locus=s99:76106:79577:+ [translate_table: standard]